MVYYKVEAEVEAKAKVELKNKKRIAKVIIGVEAKLNA